MDQPGVSQDRIGVRHDAMRLGDVLRVEAHGVSGAGSIPKRRRPGDEPGLFNSTYRATNQ